MEAGRAQLFEPAALGPVTLRNRIIKAATFEGMSWRGQVSDALVDFHRAFAAGGVGLTTLAYCAVVARRAGCAERDRAGPSGACPACAGLAEAVHAGGAAVSAQIGHAGPVGQRRITGTRAASRLVRVQPAGHPVSRDDRRRNRPGHWRFRRRRPGRGRCGLRRGRAAHGPPLPAQFVPQPEIQPAHRRWGGSTANRARFPRAVAQAVRDAVGGQLAVTAKFEMADGVPGGLWPDESIELARLLQADGTLDALQLTGGGSLANPMYLFRGDVPRKEFAATLPPALRPAFRVVGAAVAARVPVRGGVSAAAWRGSSGPRSTCR